MRWIEIGAVSCLAIAMLSSGQEQNPASVPKAPAPSVPAPAPAPHVVPQFLVLLDAAHGGNDTGARLSSTLLEKDLTLDLTNRLRSMLEARGIGVALTRNSDETLAAIDRAKIANSTPFAACILIHATATGSGVHLYTSSLAATPSMAATPSPAGAPLPAAKFMPWATAQSAYVTESMKLSSDIDSAMAHAEIPVTLGRTSLQPMDSDACAAVAVEVAPLLGGASTKAEPITDADYQRSILGALTAAIDQWRNEWREQP